uniref:transposase n=1 Tax=Saccharicrinis aurantiacus TaxID=1849719 RepID=UPI00094F4BBE
MSKDTEIFYLVDEFCKELELAKEGHVLTKDTSKNTHKRKLRMSDSGVITVLILFHLGQFRNLKHFYINYVQKHMVDDFPETVSYNRFTELQRKVLIPMSVFLQVSCLGKCTGISFIDSTLIRACHIKREKQNKIFKDLAQKDKFSLGWFYRFKLHLVINDKVRF